VVERVAPLAEEQARCEVLAGEWAPPLADFRSGAEAVPAESPVDVPAAVAGRSGSPEAESRASYSDCLAAVPEPCLTDLPPEAAESAVRAGCYPAEQDDYPPVAMGGSVVRSVAALPHSVAAQGSGDCCRAHDYFPAHDCSRAHGLADCSRAQRSDDCSPAHGFQARAVQLPERRASGLHDCSPFRDGCFPVPVRLAETLRDCFPARQGGELRRDSPVRRAALSRHDCPPPGHPGLGQLRSGRAYPPSLWRLVAMVELAPAARHARCEPVEEQHYGRPLAFPRAD